MAHFFFWHLPDQSCPLVQNSKGICGDTCLDGPSFAGGRGCSAGTRDGGSWRPCRSMLTSSLLVFSLNNSVSIASFRCNNTNSVPSSRSSLLRSCWRTLLYSERMSLHLEVYSSFFLTCGIFSLRRIHRASTTRLLFGYDAGDPADKKHLLRKEEEKGMSY